MLAQVNEQLATGVNWNLISMMVMAIFTALMWWDARKSKSVQIEGQISGTPPTNSILARDLKAMNHRIVALENWRQQLVEKLDTDKGEVIEAGEERARRIYERMEAVRKELSEKMDNIPSRLIADMANAKKL